ncbi:N-acetylmuramoyl-L-alanine amidase [Hymenobacter sp. H14-R3]|uniref:N-acetylmuramoyl-L-alanine amidase family protein n=1 Tax=Hymenobacter sp. H14-R3 TaxID=3046308 RepID=UPI0024B8C574|nr:N-acetylmuramoyl-L-alanine amidase [Hymenobacter sp. H14-R3]MDJ0366986.1 N-acetylmuramoyl-L-alanine amidase [Hymenobacter sp. H14-R3]
MRLTTKIRGRYPHQGLLVAWFFHPTTIVRIIALTCILLSAQCPVLNAQDSLTSPRPLPPVRQQVVAAPAPDSVAPRPDASGADMDPTRYRLRTVVLDAGHGGKDIGCNGASAHEADVALAIIKNLGRQIEAGSPGVRVIYTRKTDVFIELDERAAIANRNHADLFISVHCNAGPKGARGTEVWTMGLHKTDANLGVAQRENSVILQEKDYKRRYDGFDPRSPQSHILFSLFQSAYLTNSLRLAQRIDRQFRTSVGRSSRGIKQAGFIVLWKSTMPSVLVEAGFLTDRGEENYLDDKVGQQAIANGIYRAFREYKHDLEGTRGE